MGKTRVLILSATASAINYINALEDREDLDLYFTDASIYASGLYAQNITPLIVPMARDLKPYQEKLDQLIEEFNIDLLIPTSDHDMWGVMELFHNGWRPNVKYFCPDYQRYLTFTHKADLIIALTNLGLDVPRLYENLSDIKYPMVIKPTREGGSKGVWIVHDENEFEEKYKLVNAAYGDDIVLQEFVPGETGSIYVALLVYGKDGEVYGEIVTHSTLTFMTWGGGGNAGLVVDEPGLLDQAKTIIEKMGGWEGPINLEFKRSSENGEFYLMEINCRLNGYSYLTTMNGLNFPEAVINLLTKGETETLNYSKIQSPSNFVMAFRERPVDDWVKSKS